MPEYFEYILKVSVCLVFTYLFYIVLLKRLTHYNWNRYFLLGFTLLSFVIPLIDQGSMVYTSPGPVVNIMDQVPALSERMGYYTGTNVNNNYNNQWTWINWLFLSVVAILFIRLVFQFLSLKAITSRSTLIKDGKVKFYHLPGQNLPFSFLNCIYLNKDLYNETELNGIVQHELVHVVQHHSIDRILIEFVCMFNWFNPFAWLIKKAICENLEFIADEEVLNYGINKKDYQYLLVKVTGNVSSGITNYLNFSSLKNRILMMNKTRSARNHLYKFLLFIPVLLILLIAFRTSNEKDNIIVESKTTSDQSFTLSSLSYAVNDAKVEHLVKNEQYKSWLHVGEAFDLSLISNEKKRLQDLLKRNGYNDVEKNTITFLIDTASVKNNFSVQVNINLGHAGIMQNNRRATPSIKEPVAVKNDGNLSLENNKIVAGTDLSLSALDASSTKKIQMQANKTTLVK